MNQRLDIYLHVGPDDRSPAASTYCDLRPKTNDQRTVPTNRNLNRRPVAQPDLIRDLITLLRITARAGHSALAEGRAEMAYESAESCRRLRRRLQDLASPKAQWKARERAIETAERLEWALERHESRTYSPELYREAVR